MHDIAIDLLILLGGIWLVAITLRPLGLPTVMGELIVGVVVGPAVLGLIQPNDAIQLLAEIGIFFLMFLVMAFRSLFPRFDVSPNSLIRPRTFSA